MFHLYTLEGVSKDYHSLKTGEKLRVHKTVKDARIRKFVTRDKQYQDFDISESQYKDGIKAYEKAVDSRKKIYHAYEIMSSPVISADADNDILAVWKLLSDEEIKHLPVLKDGKIIGMVTDRDILEHLIIDEGKVTAPQNIRVGDIMNRAVLTAKPVADIRHMARVMFENRIGSMPIVSDKGLVGIVTRSDILHALINLEEINITV